MKFAKRIAGDEIKESVAVDVRERGRGAAVGQNQLAGTVDVPETAESISR